MADDVLMEEVFNFICGSGGFAELSFLLKDSSPLKSITTELEKKNWLKTQGRGRFVLVKDIDDEIAGVRIDLRKKICQQYLYRGLCSRAQGKCKFWHICKSFIEGNCDGECNRSHNFFDTDNKEKATELGLEKHPNGTVRNIVAWSLPQVCRLYLRNECESDICPYLHVCSKMVGGSSCHCALSHNLADSHNKKILKQYDLIPHQSMKAAFVHCSILVVEEQRYFDKDKSSNTVTVVETPASTAALNNLSNPVKSVNVQPLAKKPSLSENETKDVESSRAASNNTGRNPKQNETESSSQWETKKQKKQHSRNRVKRPAINNLTNISTTSAPGKKNLEFFNIQVEEDENCSGSSSFKTFNHIDDGEDGAHAHPADTNQCKYQIVTAQSSPSSLNAVKPSGKELKTNSEVTQTNNEPQRENLVHSCEATNDHTATKVPSCNKRCDNGKKTPASTVLCGLPAGDNSDDFVKKWVMGSDEKQSSHLKESHSLAASEDAVKVEHQRKLSVSSSCSSVPDPQKCAPSKKSVFDCILKEYNGTVSFSAISDRQDLFPNRSEDIAAWFRARKENFLLRENKEGTILEVSAFCRRAQLCFSQSCSRKDCPYLHVCRDYIAGFCRFGDRCQRNHSFQYDKDRKFLSKLKLNGLTEKNLRTVIQLSIPQVCLDYNDGRCARGQSCAQIHICKDMIKKTCEDEKDCPLQHQKALLTSHSTAILQKYGLKIRDGNFNPVLRVLLVCEDKPAGLKDYGKCTVSAAKNSVSIGATAASKVSNQLNQGVSSPSNADVIDCEPSERDVFECLCREYNCSVSFSVIAKRTDLFPSEFKNIESWFRKKKGSFLLTENDRGVISQVAAFSAKARLCFSYNNAFSGKCTKENCSYLHVCRDYVTDSCSAGATCVRNHHFHNEKDKALLSRIKLDQLTDQQLRRLVLSSAPQVCVEYNDGMCDLGGCCSRIHMCSGHLRKCSREGYDCVLDHESAMTTDHTRTVLERYHMDHLKSDVVKRIMLVYDNPTKHKQTGHVHQDKPDAPICSDFLLGKCKKGSKCSEHHCSLPFHWQYKVPKVDEWKSFSETDNETLEKLYCNVLLEDCSATGFQISFESEGLLLLDDGYDVTFLLDNKLMIVPKGLDVVFAEIRRLSAESYATNPGNPVATTWTWYWEDEDGIWREYDVDHLGGDLQRSIEEAFLNKTNDFKFRISDQHYALYFYKKTEMRQENLRYGTTRKVRRRPADIKSGADIRELKRSGKVSSANPYPGKNTTSGKIPSHWSAMPSDKQYKRVPLTATSSEYKDAEKLFEKTIKKSVVIKSIERVQNPFMWGKYQRKKENMLAAKTGSHKRLFVNEKRLFHGTSPESVEAICKQNFDWRLHGKNATMYGEGSYFALNASYSDAYAKEDMNSSRFMFVAKVLVGSYTNGRSSYRRPPQKDPSNPASDLYDSCVDDKTDPTIFVVFDTDQFYPEYIIKYSQESARYSVPSNAGAGYQLPVAGRPRPVPFSRSFQAAVSQPGASQAHFSSTATSRSSSAFGTPVYASGPSGFNSGTSSSYYTTSASNTAVPYHSTTSGPYSGTSSAFYSSSASNTSNAPYHSTTSRSNPQYGSGNRHQHQSSSQENSKCLVM